MQVTVVTRANFATVLPSVLFHLREADFVAFDTELSGLCTGPAQRYFYYDTPEERYRKLANSATSFGLLQVGLSAFKWQAGAARGKHAAAGRYTTTSWSFHVFPEAAVATSAADYRSYAVQLSSFAFLREHKFDFNKTFNEGIPYLSLAEEAALRTRRSGPTVRGAAVAVADRVPLKGASVDFVKDMEALVAAWLARASAEAGPEEDIEALADADNGGNAEKGKGAREKDSADAAKALVLPPCSSFQRLLLHQHLQDRFPETPFSINKVVNEEGTLCLAVSCVTAEEREALIREGQRECAEKVEALVGFRRIFDQIAASKKPLVGHNCFLDMVHFYQKFVGPLPADWEAFQDAWAALGFPAVCDTKHIATLAMAAGLLGGVDGTSLEALTTAADNAEAWSRCAPPAEGGEAPTAGGVIVKVPVDGGKVKNVDVSFHDGGFDAYCTGKVFVGLAALLEAHPAAHARMLAVASAPSGDAMDRAPSGDAMDGAPCGGVMDGAPCGGVMDGAVPHASLAGLVGALFSGPLAQTLHVMACDYQGARMRCEAGGATHQRHPDRQRVLVLSELPYGGRIKSAHIVASLTALGLREESVRLHWMDSGCVFVTLDCAVPAALLSLEEAAPGDGGPEEPPMRQAWRPHQITVDGEGEALPEAAVYTVRCASYDAWRRAREEASQPFGASPASRAKRMRTTF